MTEYESYLDVRLDENYTLTRKIGEGGIGSVYLAEGTNPADRLACKVIPEGRLNHGWERELEKVIKLRGVPNVVPFHRRGSSYDRNQRPFSWILWDYVPGFNLRDYLNSPTWSLDLSFIEDILKTTLKVLHACKAVDIEHGDLHEGNILIREPDTRLVGSPKTIWISDFGYGGSHNQLQPKNDFRQLFSIIATMLKRLDSAELDARDKVMHDKLTHFINKELMEVDPTQGGFASDAGRMLQDLEGLWLEAKRESDAGTNKDGLRTVGDYLYAEALGYRIEEWRNLFVPEFLAVEDLLSRNSVVLTGARGCGKTMSFRRLTVFMDKVIGTPSGVEGSDQFLGFYLNCRELVEAFPWLPQKITQSVEQQIIHYFHLAWLSEVVKTLAQFETGRDEKNQWLDSFMMSFFLERYDSLTQGASVLNHARAFIEREKERCRLTRFGKLKGLGNWPLARLDFLDRLQEALEHNSDWTGDRPVYLFLDDYTIPTVVLDVQKVLNPIIFKRRSKLFFKISTESSNSFSREGLHGKPLELHQDFELIDLATETIHQESDAKEKFLERIFRPRIDRHTALKGKQLGLKEILGKMSHSNNELAFLMRDAVKQGKKKTIHYHGLGAFVGMWSSDIRIMIQMFVDMLRESNGSLRAGTAQVAPDIQDKVYRAAGGELLTLIESVKDPTSWDREPYSTRIGEPFGVQLKDIVEAFVNVSRFEMTKGPLVRNQRRVNPKQAFRLEIIDKFDLAPEVMKYYEGLVRWHVFLQDWRGKSVRGMITPRLYLNRVFIPISKLTFSSHDNIHLTSEQFQSLLSQPKSFFEQWKEKKKGGRHARRKTNPSGNPSQLELRMMALQRVKRGGRKK